MGRNFIINEETLEKVREKLEMTPDRFNSNIRYFLHQLMSDPVNAQPTFALKENGLTRAKLLYYLHTLRFRKLRDHFRGSTASRLPTASARTGSRSFVASSALCSRRSRMRTPPC